MNRRQVVITEAVLDAARRVAERHGLPLIYTGRHPVSPARLSGAGWTVAAFVDGSAALHLQLDADVDVLRAALVTRDMHRELGRAFAALPEELQRVPEPDVADVTDLAEAP